MNHPVCVYRDMETAAFAATCARDRGATAQVKTEKHHINDHSESLFVLKTTKSDTQKVLDSIADAAAFNPRLTDNAERCPQCDSILVEYPEQPETSPTMKGIAKLMQGIDRMFNRADNHKFHCKHCEHSWK